MGPYGPSSLSDQLLRSALTVLFTIVAIHIAWRLIQPLLGPLIVIIVLLGIVRMATGWRSRNRW